MLFRLFLVVFGLFLVVFGLFLVVFVALLLLLMVFVLFLFLAIVLCLLFQKKRVCWPAGWRVNSKLMRANRPLLPRPVSHQTAVALSSGGSEG